VSGDCPSASPSGKSSVEVEAQPIVKSIRRHCCEGERTVLENYLEVTADKTWCRTEVQRAYLRFVRHERGLSRGNGVILIELIISGICEYSGLIIERLIVISTW